jgi:prevent-host-death family protein
MPKTKTKTKSSSRAPVTAVAHRTSVTTTEAKNGFGRVLEIALRSGAVTITRRDTPKAVLLSYDEFERLTAVRSDQLEALTAEFDQMFDRMQDAHSQARMRAAFNVSSAGLGAMAVAAAKRHG